MRKILLAPLLFRLTAIVSTAKADTSPVDILAPLYNNYLANGAIGVFERNTNCWAYSIDLSCAAVWNSSSANYHLATLISPRHVLGANHAATLLRCIAMRRRFRLQWTSSVRGIPSPS